MKHDVIRLSPLASAIAQEIYRRRVNEGNTSFRKRIADEAFMCLYEKLYGETALNKIITSLEEKDTNNVR